MYTRYEADRWSIKQLRSKFALCIIEEDAVAATQYTLRQHKLPMAIDKEKEKENDEHLAIDAFGATNEFLAKYYPSKVVKGPRKTEVAMKHHRTYIEQLELYREDPRSLAAIHAVRRSREAIWI